MTVVTESEGRRIVRVELGPRSYDIVVGEGLLSRLSGLVTPWITERFGIASSPAAFLITDANAARYAQQAAQSLREGGYRTQTLEIEPGEPSKRLEVISRAWDELVAFQADRRTLVLAVGGGVVGDAAGFAAATFARGLPFVQVPTTLLADVDSSVGGKVGINHPRAKNLIGAFHQPIGVVVDTQALGTLPDREFRAGLAEVVKYGVILDEAFFGLLEQNVARIRAREADILRQLIARSCELKALVVEEDEFERSGRRAALNYGHTFGHAFESLAGYGALLHGEAVAIGMVCASRLAEQLGRIDASVTERQIALLRGLGLPVALPSSLRLDVDETLRRMKLDKKTLEGTLRFVLPDRLGAVSLVSHVPETAVRALLQSFSGQQASI